MKGKRRMRRQWNPYSMERNPMVGAIRDINRTTMGLVGIGAVTTMGMGVLGALKK